MRNATQYRLLLLAVGLLGFGRFGAPTVLATASILGVWPLVASAQQSGHPHHDMKQCNQQTAYILLGAYYRVQTDFQPVQDLYYSVVILTFHDRQYVG